MPTESFGFGDWRLSAVFTRRNPEQSFTTEDTEVTEELRAAIAHVDEKHLGRTLRVRRLYSERETLK